MATTLQVIADVHAGSPAEGHASNRKLTHRALETLEGALAEGEGRTPLDGRIDLGDLIEHAGSHTRPEARAQIDTANFSEALQLYRNPSVPSLHCIGNHPLMAATDKMISDTLGLETPYYARDIGDHRVIMLHSRFTHRTTSPQHPSGSGIFLDQKQLRWLRTELVSPKWVKRGSKWEVGPTLRHPAMVSRVQRERERAS